MLFFPWLLLVLCGDSWAMHETDAGVVDWHKYLIGVPSVHSADTAPVFHISMNQSFVLTVTDKNVLAALVPEDGTVAWRHVFDPSDRIAGFYRGSDIVATLSGSGGATLRTFEPQSGHLILEHRLHVPQEGHFWEPPSFGQHVVFVPGTSMIYVLTNGHTITHMDGIADEVKWRWRSPDQSSLVIYSRLIFTSDALYVIGFAKSLVSYTLYVSALSPDSGDLLAANDIPSSIEDPLNQIITLTNGDNTCARVMWLENGILHSVKLNPTLNAKPSKERNGEYTHLMNVGISSLGQAVAIKSDGSGCVLSLVGHDPGVQSVYTFSDSASSEKYTKSIYSGGVDATGSPYIARVYWNHALKKYATVVFADHLRMSEPATSYFAFDSTTHGLPKHVALDPTKHNDTSVAPRFVVTTSTGAVQMWSQDTVSWMREESLSDVVLAEFVEIPERIAVTSARLVGDEDFISRLVRHAHDIKNFPSYAAHFVKRFVSGSYPSSVSFPSPTSGYDSILLRDAFGFRQVIVTATRAGKVYGLDSISGKILWSRVLGLDKDAYLDGIIHPVKLFVTRTVSDGGAPEVVLVTKREATHGSVDTVLFHFNALNGEEVQPGSMTNGTPHTISGSMTDAFLLPSEPRIVAVIDESLQVHIHPNTPETRTTFAMAAPSLVFPMLRSTEGDRNIVGHQFILDDNLSERFAAFPAWTFTPPADETIKSMMPQLRIGPVASFGKVLGNKTTAYKYLNPRLFTVLTESPSASICGLYLLDSIKGTVVYSAHVPGVGGSCDIKAVFSENWLVYHYFDADEQSVNGAKGWRMVSVELYEGQADEKTRSSEMSGYNNAVMTYTAYAEAYVFPQAITAITMTATKFGITSKDIIVATKDGHIQSFPRRLLNPRRPHHKPTAEEIEEQLIPYDPVLFNDALLMHSHNYQVLNTEHIVTAPALLESTSLVLAYGLDMFLTRVAPSGTFDVLSESFSKVQLVLTVTGLVFAILVTKPMVARKRLREKWYF